MASIATRTRILSLLNAAELTARTVGKLGTRTTDPAERVAYTERESQVIDAYIELDGYLTLADNGASDAKLKAAGYDPQRIESVIWSKGTPP